MYENASNYNPEATKDDGSCVYNSDFIEINNVDKSIVFSKKHKHDTTKITNINHNKISIIMMPSGTGKTTTLNLLRYSFFDYSNIRFGI